MLFIQFYPKTLTVIDFTDRLSITVSTPASYVELMSTISTAVFKTFGLVAGRQRCCAAVRMRLRRRAPPSPVAGRSNPVATCRAATGFARDRR